MPHTKELLAICVITVGSVFCDTDRMTTNSLRVVYLLRSVSNPDHHYVGITASMNARLEWHNAGPCGYTTAYRPWRLVVQIEFDDERTARHFERYLKSGSGRAFAKRHFGGT